jgi:26S proteasome regulatory subunit T5
MNPDDEAEEDGANIDLDSQRKGKCVVLKTSTRQVITPFYLHRDL